MPTDIKTAIFALGSASLGAVNDLCVFLTDLERDGKIGGWKFMRHTNFARTSMQIDFMDPADAHRAIDAWSKRVYIDARTQHATRHGSILHPTEQ